MTSVSGLVAAVIDELDAAAVALFPAWLPGAEGIEGPGGAHLPAVRALALRRAAASEHYGPFLAELAERALAGGPSGLRPEVRAAGLARALADSFGRSRTALLVRVPDGLTAAGQEVLVAACEWLAHRGGRWGGVAGGRAAGRRRSAGDGQAAPSRSHRPRRPRAAAGVVPGAGRTAASRQSR
ncbi:hypothetical protein [Nonomuraea salmonea]|uniref:hypothetical protein n=1 Tax=Nonomuraea salmonea TaxID=46181 RepID=UPI002FE9BB76